MKRVTQNLKYTPNRRRVHLDETSFGPVVKLVLAAVLIIGFAVLTALVIVPFLKDWFAGRAALPWQEQTSPRPALTAEPAHPILSNAVDTVRFGDGVDAGVVVDPSIHDDRILFATGEEAARCDRLVRLDPFSGQSEVIEIDLQFDALRYPVEDAERIVYIDARAGGGGSIRLLEKASGETETLYELAWDIPRLFFEWPYLVWTERADESLSRLFALDLTSGEAVTLARFEDSPYASSAPSVRSGQVLYADEDMGQPGASLIRTVLLSDASRWDYAAGSYVHDPKTVGDRWAYLTGDHGEESDLYVVSGGGAPLRIARGAVDFAITPTCVVYNRDETVYAYVFSDHKTYVLSETSHNAQLVTAGGSYALWRDLTDEDQSVWKYIKVV